MHLVKYWKDCYRPQTKFAKVMFSQVSVCPQGMALPPLHAGIHPPGQTATPWADPPRQTPPLGSACWDTVNKQAVRILLECILVVNDFGAEKYDLL